MEEQTINVTYKNHDFSIATKLRSHADSDTTIVFIHGLGCAKESFDAAFTSLALSHFSIVTFDLPGFGASSKPDDFSYVVEDQAEIVSLLIKSLAAKNIVIAAHSMGGAIGLLVAPKLNNLITYINIEGNLVAEDAGIVSRRTAEQPERDFIDRGFDEFLDGLVNSGRKDLETWAKWYEQSSRLAIYRASKSLVEWSDSGKLINYFNALPHKSYIYGDEGSKDYLLVQFQDVKTCCITESGHFMMLDNPADFYRAVVSSITASL